MNRRLPLSDAQAQLNRTANMRPSDYNTSWKCVPQSYAYAYQDRQVAMPLNSPQWFATPRQRYTRMVSVEDYLNASNQPLYPTHTGTVSPCFSPPRSYHRPPIKRPKLYSTDKDTDCEIWNPTMSSHVLKTPPHRRQRSVSEGRECTVDTPRRRYMYQTCRDVWGSGGRGAQRTRNLASENCEEEREGRTSIRDSPNRQSKEDKSVSASSKDTSTRQKQLARDKAPIEWQSPADFVWPGMLSSDGDVDNYRLNKRRASIADTLIISDDSDDEATPFSLPPSSIRSPSMSYSTPNKSQPASPSTPFMARLLQLKEDELNSDDDETGAGQTRKTSFSNLPTTDASKIGRLPSSEDGTKCADHDELWRRRARSLPCEESHTTDREALVNEIFALRQMLTESRRTRRVVIGNGKGLVIPESADTSVLVALEDICQGPTETKTKDNRLDKPTHATSVDATNVRPTNQASSTTTSNSGSSKDLDRAQPSANGHIQVRRSPRKHRSSLLNKVPPQSPSKKHRKPPPTNISQAPRRTSSSQALPKIPSSQNPPAQNNDSGNSKSGNDQEAAGSVSRLPRPGEILAVHGNKPQSSTNDSMAMPSRRDKHRPPRSFSDGPRIKPPRSKPQRAEENADGVLTIFDHEAFAELLQPSSVVFDDDLLRSVIDDDQLLSSVMEVTGQISAIACKGPSNDLLTDMFSEFEVEESVEDAGVVPSLVSDNFLTTDTTLLTDQLQMTDTTTPGRTPAKNRLQGTAAKKPGQQPIVFDEWLHLDTQ
ncbi:hypothetical protein BZG36_01397 [Bifiguratus adelaidae]|uniref:Uncharacterized protein n=1 Tax=Bifiguratus adelaidae TaxID=1938954 RepID=A0A261Y3D9_9FUNG|nr:hypothetical protein BZG36_01397 [Bifiguratus adelaidae]